MHIEKHGKWTVTVIDDYEEIRPIVEELMRGTANPEKRVRLPSDS